MNGMAMKNRLGASPSLDFGVMSFLWQGSFSIGNHSMFWKKENKICLEEVCLNSRNQALPNVEKFLYPDLFPCFGVELCILGYSRDDIESHQLVSYLLLDVHIFADAVLDIKTCLLQHLQSS